MKSLTQPEGTARGDALDLIRKNLHLLDDRTLGSELGLCRIETAELPRPDIQVCPEIEAATTWWAESLRHQPEMDNGDPFQSGLAGMLADRAYIRLTDEQIETFRLWLRAVLQATQAGGGWDPKQPIFASALRGIYNDYHPDWQLCLAWRRAALPGKPDRRFPIKTSMRINPGCVTVRVGYTGREQTIYGR